jgi:uncharacterized protein
MISKMDSAFIGPLLKTAETHISLVYLYRDFVIKIKKPVKLDFLDFSTLEKRKFYCEEEVRLNRRLCSGIYLGVFPILKKINNKPSEQYKFPDNIRECLKQTGEGYSEPSSPEETEDGFEITEYSVIMKRLPEEGFLKNLLNKNDVLFNQKLLLSVSVSLENFYKKEKALFLSEDDYYGKLKSSIYGNYHDPETKFTDEYTSLKIKFLKEYQGSLLSQAGSKDLLVSRIQNGHLRDAHGDLHLDHIYINTHDQKVCIYDCTEFSADFRSIDIACDLSFLAMDLDFHGYFKESLYFTNLMSERLNDDFIYKYSVFFKIYRALVRSKVHLLTSLSESLTGTEKETQVQISRAYLDLAFRYLVIPKMPVIIIVFGFIASGKSHTAGILGKLLHNEVFSSDRIRKELAGIPEIRSQIRTPENIKKKLYSSEMSDLTYDTVYFRAKEYAQAGGKGTALIDASFMSETRRIKICNQSEQDGINLMWIEVSAEKDIVKRRLKARDTWDKEDNLTAEYNDKEKLTGRETDARTDDYEKLEKFWENPDESSIKTVKNRVIFRSDKESLSDLISAMSSKRERYYNEQP